ncbi:hypothetical protein [Niveispirillum fermenti]|uniref:hypothetical protein n=1 Tax=Niveispirillum fermenti TaxID=1233113 RepID=UPI003A88C532
MTLLVTLLVPMLVALSPVPQGGRSFAVILPPWMARDAQIATLADTGVRLREGGAPVWIVDVPDQESARRLAALPALLLSGTLVGCGS